MQYYPLRYPDLVQADPVGALARGYGAVQGALRSNQQAALGQMQLQQAQDEQAAAKTFAQTGSLDQMRAANPERAFKLDEANLGWVKSQAEMLMGNPNAPQVWPGVKAEAEKRGIKGLPDQYPGDAWVVAKQKAILGMKTQEDIAKYQQTKGPVDWAKVQQGETKLRQQGFKIENQVKHWNQIDERGWANYGLKGSAPVAVVDTETNTPMTMPLNEFSKAYAENPGRYAPYDKGGKGRKGKTPEEIAMAANSHARMMVGKDESYKRIRAEEEVDSSYNPTGKYKVGDKTGLTKEQANQEVKAQQDSVFNRYRQGYLDSVNNMSKAMDATKGLGTPGRGGKGKGGPSAAPGSERDAWESLRKRPGYENLPPYDEVVKGSAPPVAVAPSVNEEEEED